MIHLSRRLRMNASFVTPGNRLADVGTDHAYLPIVLVQEGVIPSAIAMDVNPGPLAHAKAHIREYHLESCIHTRLSDGVQSLRPGEADSVLIAGMGGALTVRILQEGAEVLRTVKELILQPQSELASVRRYLARAGYRITGEDMVWEDGKYYTVLRAAAGEPLEDRAVFYEYGKWLLESRHPVLWDYLCVRKQICIRIREQLNKSGLPDWQKLGSGVKSELSDSQAHENWTAGAKSMPDSQDQENHEVQTGSGLAGSRIRLRLGELEQELALIEEAQSWYGKAAASLQRPANGTDRNEKLKSEN